MSEVVCTCSGCVDVDVDVVALDQYKAVDFPRRLRSRAASGVQLMTTRNLKSGAVMRRTQTISTAKGTAAVWAIESERPGNTGICHDPYARRFTSTVFYLLIRLFAGYGERRTHGALTFIVCRSRYFDDYLKACLASGMSQLVILGAGLDSRTYRDPLQGVVKIFEVDHPATQASKIKRVKKVLGTIPTNVVYVPIDFDEETLDKLLAYGFDRSLKTLFIWEGVTYYLNWKAVDATLAWLGTNAAPSSTIIFDYEYAFASTRADRRHYLYSVLSCLDGERRAFCIKSGQIEDLLAGRGVTQVLDVSADQLKRLYCMGPNQDRTVAQKYAIVHAEIGRHQVQVST
jgi:methyltransferase (TIGR00027 family)